MMIRWKRGGGDGFSGFENGLTYLCISRMLLCMRTTIDLDDELLKQVRQMAARTNRTMRSIIEDALRANLNRRPDERRRKVELPVSKRKGGLKPGVDIDNTAALLDILDAHDDAA